MRSMHSALSARLRAGGSHALVAAHRPITSVPASGPKKGVRQAPPPTDRLKDSMGYFGNYSTSNVVMEDTPYVPKEKRQDLLREAMSRKQNLKSTNKLDILRTSLTKVREKDPGADEWNDVLMHMRSTEFCTELVQNSTDVFPKGAKLWIELENCEERRQPYFVMLPNKMIVVPIFSYEEYQDHFFSRLNLFESVWFPSPRMGSVYEQYCALPFPVCAIGTLKHLSALATMSVPSHQFGVVINPGQRESKFVTYPEMVFLAKQKHGSLITNLDLRNFDDSLLKTFDTSRMEFVRLSAEEVQHVVSSRAPRMVPPIAQLELQLLLFPFSDVAEVYIRTVAKSKWSRVLNGGTEQVTQLDVVVYDSNRDDTRHRGKEQAGGESDKWRGELTSVIQRWSFLREFNSDIRVQFCTAPPQADDAEGAVKLYEGTDGSLFRLSATRKSMSLRQALDYDAPLFDSTGNEVDTSSKEHR